MQTSYSPTRLFVCHLRGIPLSVLGKSEIRLGRTSSGTPLMHATNSAVFGSQQMVI